MKNSEKFKRKMIINKITYLIITIITLLILTRYFIIELCPYINKYLALAIYIFIVVSILIISYYCIFNKNKYTKKELDIICDELDNKLDKSYEKYGIYITEKYIVCIGSKFNIITFFSIPINKINAIDTGLDSRFFYRKKGKKRNFMSSLIKDSIYFGDNNTKVLNFICDDKVYCAAAVHNFSKKKIKELSKIADYICEKHKNIDYI